MLCPHCGTPSDNKRFCTQCGTELLKTQVVAEPVVDPIATSASRQPTVPYQPAKTADALTGRTLDHKYYLESRLGVGGMGTVYSARRLMIGDSVAIKILHPDQVADPQSVERFRREAQTAARLKHPNVVTVYDFGVSHDGLIYLVMELAGGNSLRQLIEREGVLTEDLAAEITRQVCAALGEAHRQGVVHRDIKPENIIAQTTPRGLQVKVLDFGIAALRDMTMSRLTRTGGIVGTPHYMSPEHCLGEDLDGRSDIYSLGVVMFEMLTGVAPFDSPTPTAVVVQQVNQPPPSLRSLNPNVSPAVESVVLHALEKRREARPQTTDDLARELMSAVNKTTVISSRPTMITPPGDFAPAPEPASSSSAATLRVDAPPFAGASANKGSNSKPILLIFCALVLLMAGVAGGFWWYLQKGGGAGESAERDGQSSTVSNQPADQVRRVDNPVPTSPTPNSPPKTSDNLWEALTDQTTGATGAAMALGAADQQMAVIKPGGQLALGYREGQFFGDGQGADLRVYGPEQERVSYLIFVRDNPADNWRRIDINRKGFPQGVAAHDMGHHGVSRARQVMIRNTGNTDLSIDAITVAYKDKAHSESATRHRH